MKINSKLSYGILSFVIVLINAFNYQSYAQTEPIYIDEYTDTLQSSTTRPPSDFVFTENNETELDPIILANPLGGIAPLDIVYVSSVNSYYIYGYHNIIVVDATNHQIIESINISNYGVTSQSAIATLTNADAKRLAFNQNTNELYCITEDLNFIVIDVLTNEIMDSETTNLGDPNSETGKYYWTFMQYDDRTNNIFVIIVNASNNDRETYYNVFDANSHTKIHHNYFTDRLRGFAVNQDRDRVYFSFENKFQVWDISTSNLINEKVSDRTMGNILYINNEINNIHKVICFPFDHENTPNSYACVFNGDNDNISTFQLDKAYIYGSEYNPISNKIYYSYKNPGYGIKIISADNYSNLANLNVSVNNSMYIKDLTFVDNNKIIGGVCNLGNRITENNGAIIIDGNTNNYVELEDIPKGFNYQIAVNNNTNEAAMVSFLDGSVSFIDNTGSFNGALALGGSAKQGVYNNIENKVYTYNRYIGKVFINDMDNNQSTFVDIGDINYFEYISGVVYDKDKNLVYVSVYSNSNKIKIIDGQTDQLLTTEINLTNSFCNNIFYGNNNKLYCATGKYPETEAIEIVDLNTYGVINSTGLYPPIYNTYYNTWFDLTNNGDIIVSVNDIGSNLGSVEVIDKEQDIVEVYYTIPAPYKIAYNPVNNKVYTCKFDAIYGTGGSDLTVIELDNGNINSLHTNMEQVISLEYCNKQNYLALFGYAIVNNVLQPEITNIDGQSNEISFAGTVDYFTSGIKYNPINGNLYTLVAINQSSNERMEYWSLNNFYNLSSITQSTMYERYWGIGLFSINSNNIILNTNNNQLIIPTGYHSRLNVLQCEDEKAMLTSSGGYNWISYPKMERNHLINEPYNTRTLLENLDPLPDKLTMEGKYGFDNVFFYKEGNVWLENQIPDVQSTRGYKLSTTNNGTTWLPLTGTRMESDYPINVFAGHENWVGYFLLQPQSPLDAFADLLPNMSRAKGHDWTLVLFGVPGGGTEWVLQPEDAQLRYGDMAVVEVSTNRTFQWNAFGAPGNGNLDKPEQFTYTELPDYTPIFIEPDPDNQPMEIGAFVNDTCIGACVVENTDTLVLLKGYMVGNPEDSVVFENYYGTKSSKPNIISDYYVFNQENKTHEMRTIKLGENKLYHYVSFKKPSEHVVVNTKLQMDVFPNPLHNIANISFVLSKDKSVSLKILDQMGRVINTKEIGAFNAGFHNVKCEIKDYAGNNLKPGLYIIKLTAGSTFANKKVIIK